MKKLVTVFLVVIGSLFLTACTTEEPNDNKDDPQEPVVLQLTIEELAMYDGEDGNDAYIAVDGVVYDVTGVAAWSSGTHNGGMVGTDVSELISSAPHGESVLDNLTVVGEIIE